MATSLAGSRVSVTHTAVKLATGVGTLDVNGVRVLIRNKDSTNPIYLGGSGVTTATGFELDAGESVPLRLFGDDELWALADTGNTVVVHMLTAGF